MDPDNIEEAERSFQKFVELSEALESQNSIMQEESKKFLDTRFCPLIKDKCKKMECAWYVICLNKNTNAFKQYFQ